MRSLLCLPRHSSNGQMNVRSLAGIGNLLFTQLHEPCDLLGGAVAALVGTRCAMFAALLCKPSRSCACLPISVMFCEARNDAAPLPAPVQCWGCWAVAARCWPPPRRRAPKN